VVGGVCAPATVQEAAMVAAEEVDDWWGGWQVVKFVLVKKEFLRSLATRHIP
jgi:hypothetical protein